MKNRSFFHIATFLILFLFVSENNLFAQSTPFNKGINLASWFQAGSPRQVQFSKYTKTDFEQIKSLGCDVIRIPIDLHAMTNGAPDYTPDPLFFSFFDEVVNWAEELEIYVILDNHSPDESSNGTSPQVGTILKKVWPQVAAHYKNRSDFLLYEIKNEPNNINETTWNTIQGEVLELIREVDDKHTIIVGPANWNSFQSLAAMPDYEDNNLIYTFHFYDPFIFTHQGASWVGPKTGTIANIPFPFGSNPMPPKPNSFDGDWLENLFDNYEEEGTLEKVKELIDIAVKFREERNAPIFCGEFGVFIPNSQNEDRVRWHKLVANYFEEKGISSTLWDYRGGFGIYNDQGSLFNHHLNIPLVEALGFNVPPQTPFIATPDSVGFPVYNDFIASKINESSFGVNELNYYSENQPADGEYAIHWTQANRYTGIGWTFSPRKDLNYLVEQNYALELMVRTDDSDGQLDIRFLDSKLSPTERPWRSRITLHGKDLSNGEWNRIYIPLKEFKEQGSWDNEMWFNPEGKFDWGDIDKLEIVAEYDDMGSANWWFDNIQVINENLSTSLSDLTPNLLFNIFPNPATHIITLSGMETTKNYRYQLVGTYGKVVKQNQSMQSATIDLSSLNQGMYWLYITNNKGDFGVKKIMKF